MPGRSCSACWRSIPPQALAASRLPCLVLQGAADRQVVPMEDVQPLIDALGKRDAPGEAVIVPAASHNLKVAQWPTDAGFAGPDRARRRRPSSRAG